MRGETAFRIAFWVLFAGLLAMRVYFAQQVRRAGERVMPDSRAVEREGRLVFFARVTLFVLLLAWLGLYAVNPPWMAVLSIPLPGWLRWLGFVLGLGSLAFWTWTQVALGKEWSPQLQLRERHHLVTIGPYARVRHPLYTAMIGWGLALALVSANWVLVILAAATIIGVLLRIPREEQMLIEEFGDEYRAYISRTGRLLPR